MEQHATQGDTLPDAGCTGPGRWVALCLTCGWEKEGPYLEGQEGEGLEMAHLMGELHETAELFRQVKRRG